MAVSDNDLLLIQRGNTPLKTDAKTFSNYIKADLEPTDLPIATASTLGVIRVGANLSINASTGVLDAELPAGMEYQGVWTDTDNLPDDLVNGYFWYWDGGDGSVLNNPLWGAIDGETINDGDQLIYDGAKFDLIKSGGGGGGVTEIEGEAPITVNDDDASKPSIGITPASGTAAGSMSAAHWTKLEGITAGAEPNEALDLDYTASAIKGTMTISGGGESADIDLATTVVAGLMSPADKTAINDLVANGSGVMSVVAGDGIDVNNDTPGAPVVSVDFGATPNGTPKTVMPYDISVLSELA